MSKVKVSKAREKRGFVADRQEKMSSGKDNGTQAIWEALRGLRKAILKPQLIARVIESKAKARA